jgi:putative hydrolase of the HAD superfamily
MIRAVVCDFGGVLTTPLEGSFQAFADASEIPLEAIAAALVAIHERDGLHPLYELECGRVSEPDFMADVAATLAASLGRDVAMHDFTARYFEGLSRNEPMIELMAALRDEGYRMALLTNNVREWEPHWRAMAPIDDIFELVVDSAFVGMRKPDREIYDLTVQRLGVGAHECLFVDDLQRNCDAAREAGMTAVVYRSPAQASAEIRAAVRAAEPAPPPAEDDVAPPDPEDDAAPPAAEKDAAPAPA